LRQRDFLKSFLASQQEEFLTTFLLAHCGGGQDKPGCLGPSAKLPRHCFFVAIRIWYHFHSPPHPWMFRTGGVLRVRNLSPRRPLVRPPLPLRRLYLRAGDFHSAGRRGWRQPSRRAA
jgi:hypothetical protein